MSLLLRSRFSCDMPDFCCFPPFFMHPISQICEDPNSRKDIRLAKLESASIYHDVGWGTLFLAFFSYDSLSLWWMSLSSLAKPPIVFLVTTWFLVLPFLFLLQAVPARQHLSLTVSVLNTEANVTTIGGASNALKGVDRIIAANRYKIWDISFFLYVI